MTCAKMYYQAVVTETEGPVGENNFDVQPVDVGFIVSSPVNKTCEDLCNILERSKSDRTLLSLSFFVFLTKLILTRESYKKCFQLFVATNKDHEIPRNVCFHVNIRKEKKRLEIWIFFLIILTSAYLCC